MQFHLSPYQLKKARSLYNIFNTLNGLAFTLLSGNIITLYALRLGVSATVIGVLNALVFSSFFFMPVGKYLVRRHPIVQVFATAWLFRYVGMIPILFIPLAVQGARLDIALVLLLLSVSLFHITRGVGMIGNNPVLNELAAGPDRGAYMTTIQIIGSGVSLVTNLLLALLLGRNPPLLMYTLILGFGIGAGIFSSFMLYRIPEPARENPAGEQDFFSTVQHAFARAPFRRFMVIFLTLSFVSSVARSFLVVYGRQVYHQGDGMIAFYSVFGGIGALMVGLLTRLLVDRIGAKPLYVSFTFTALLGLALVLLSPAMNLLSSEEAYPFSQNVIVVLLCTIFFIVNFAFAGTEGVAQPYFFGLVRPTDILDLGILYYIVYGLAGAFGSFVAGVFLDMVGQWGISPLWAFRMLYGFLSLLTILVLYWQRKLIRLGALPLRGALAVIFSFKDLRALTLLDKLEKTTQPEEEQALLEALHENPSPVALSDLLTRLRSPRLMVRLEALRAIDALEDLSPEARDALMEDVVHNPFTTAYASARILGNHGVREAIPLLRQAVFSEDYMLAGEALLALARLRDEESRSLIEKVVSSSHNPRLQIMGALALEILGSMESLGVLLDVIRYEHPAPYVRDEITLAMAGILGVGKEFYAVLVQYLSDPLLLSPLVMDMLEEAINTCLKGKRKQTREKMIPIFQDLRIAMEQYLGERKGVPLSCWIQKHLGNLKNPGGFLFAEIVLEDELAPYERLRLLVGTWIAKHLEHLSW
ncbi:MFS transporter [Treponema sp. J25]|uniref:MFS transporter n=1 Tax=Treponema sp. J25 TaxID=2094121 RepID=UPI0010531BB8|nr:MFS transporter [Treponema sp. J25]TCW62359.1 MFS transporter [Treponema sp. J25]